MELKPMHIKECGMETKIQQMAFKYSREKYICEFLEKHPEILKDEEEVQEKIEPVEKPILTDMNVIKEKIIQTVELGDMIYSYGEEEKKNLLKNILKEVVFLNLKNQLTEETLGAVIEKYIKL